MHEINESGRDRRINFGGPKWINGAVMGRKTRTRAHLGPLSQNQTIFDFYDPFYTVQIEAWF